MKNYSLQASRYAKVIKEMEHKLSLPNFNEMLLQKCTENEISYPQTRIIMGLDEFRFGKADPKYAHMRERTFQEQKFDRMITIACNSEPKILKVMKIHFSINGDPYHYYSKNWKENLNHFTNMLHAYLHSVENVRIAIVNIHRTAVNSLLIENQLMLVANEEPNYYNF